MGGWLFTVTGNGTDLNAAMNDAIERNRREHNENDEQWSIAQKTRAVLLDSPAMSLADATTTATDLARTQIDVFGDHFTETCGALRLAGDDGQHDGFLFFGWANE